MQRALDLLAIGDPCADLVYRAERLPGWDDKAVGLAVGLFGGGTEANLACTAARLGWRVALFGRTGDDLYADFIGQDLALHGVGLQHLRRSAGASSSLALVALSAGGERSVVWLPPGAPPGASAGAPDDRGAERRAALADARWACTMPYDAAALLTLARETAAAGTRLALDLEAAGVAALAAAGCGWAQLLKCCDLVFMNRGGFEAATGEPPTPQRLAARLAGGRARTLVVTLGADGALAADRDEGNAQQPALPAQVLDSTGAGDSFNAAFLVARDRGATLGAALAQAARVGALTVGALGARGALHRLGAQAGPAA